MKERSLEGSHRVKLGRKRENPWLFLNPPMLRMKRSMAEKPQWAWVAPKLDEAAAAGEGGREEAPAAAKKKWLRRERVVRLQT